MLIDYRYYLEEDPFVEAVIEMAMPIAHGEYDYPTLCQVAPHRAYVLEIEHRCVIIVDRFKSLYFVDALLSVRDFPFHTPAGILSREHWLRITLDVLLSRITSLRDCVYFLVDAVFQIRLDPRAITLRNLGQAALPEELKDLLATLAAEARHIREDRDRHLHRGEERDLFDPTVAFKGAALLEIHRPHDNFDVDLGDGRALKLSELHEAVVTKIRADYHEAGDALFRHVQAILRVVEREYWRRWSELRDTAKIVAEWERT